MTRIFLLYVMLLFCVGVRAQQFGGFPSSTHWKQINTDTARIIFTGPVTYQAERIATLIHKMAAAQHNTLGPAVRKINILLHNNTTLANGYVALAPFRSEYYLIPGADVFEFGNLPWYEQLAVHEYRHVQQYSNFNKGISHLLSIILGEEGQAVANGLTVPSWFFEGDAVHAETALTPQGRGRLPLFLNGYNSLWHAGKNYSLAKLLNGSLKDYVPSYYQFGYLVVNYGYQKYGPLFWGKVVADASAYRGLIFPYQRAIRRYSSVPAHRFYQDAFHYYKQSLTEVADKKGLPKKVVNYYFSQDLSTDSTLYLKEAYHKLPAFYIKSGSTERRLKQKNLGAEQWFSYRHGAIAYTAYAVDPRWKLKEYNDIVLLDVHNGKERRLTKKHKYFTPDFSPSGNSLIAVHIDDSVHTALHLLNRKDGSIRKTFAPPLHSGFSNPRFVTEDLIVTGLRNEDATMSLNLLQLSTGRITPLIPPTFCTLGFPFVANNTVYFTASFSGNDDLYAWRLKEQKLYQLTSGQGGNYFVTTYKDTFLWSHFTAGGLLPRKRGTGDLLWKEVDPTQMPVVPYPVADVTRNILATETKSFAVTKYSKSTGLIDFHSRRPYYEDPEFTFTLYSDNVLNTFSNQILYRYNQNEGSHGVGFNTAYAGFYPVFTSGFEYTFSRHVKRLTKEYVFNQVEARAGYYIPLNFSRGKTYRFLNFGTNYVFNRLLPQGSLKDSLKTDNIHYLRHFITWTQQLPRAVQHIYPKFGYALSLEQRHRLEKKGYQFWGTGQLYLPSIANHSLQVSGSFQQTDTSNLLFANRFANSRGYRDYYLSKMWRASVNYHLPLLYPDFGINSLVYLQRIRANLFYDFTKVYSNNKKVTRNLRSTGAELFFDTIWGAQVPVSFGVRYSYLLDKELTGPTTRHQFGFVIPVNIIPQ